MDSLLFKSPETPDSTLQLCALQRLKVCSQWYDPLSWCFKAKHRKSVQKPSIISCHHLPVLGISGDQSGSTLHSCREEASSDREPSGGHREASGSILSASGDKSCDHCQETRGSLCSKYGQCFKQQTTDSWWWCTTSFHQEGGVCCETGSYEEQPAWREWWEWIVRLYSSTLGHSSPVTKVKYVGKFHSLHLLFIFLLIWLCIAHLLVMCLSFQRACSNEWVTVWHWGL